MQMTTKTRTKTQASPSRRCNRPNCLPRTRRMSASGRRFRKGTFTSSLFNFSSTKGTPRRIARFAALEIIHDRLANHRLFTDSALVSPDHVARELSAQNCARLHNNPLFCSNGLPPVIQPLLPRRHARVDLEKRARAPHCPISSALKGNRRVNQEVVDMPKVCCQARRHEPQNQNPEDRRTD
jgi:hypothetical protein